MSKSRRRIANFTAEQKVRILREHLSEDVPLSDVCDRHGIRPSQFHTWQKQLFENAFTLLTVQDESGFRVSIRRSLGDFAQESRRG